MHEVWYLKEISFQPEPEAPTRRVKIVTQNFNGLVALSVASFTYVFNPLHVAAGHARSLQYVGLIFSFVGWVLAHRWTRQHPDPAGTYTNTSI